MRGRPAPWLFVLIGLSTGVGCARPSTPSGGEVPSTPLRVVESRPGSLSVVDPFGDHVEIRFQRTLSEQLTGGTPREAVIVSPRTGEVQIQIRGDALRISMEGGFQAPDVYRITVLPRFRDRYDNTLPGPFDLVFSTGGPLQPNLAAGIAFDRLTMGPMEGIRVDAVPAMEGGTHSTVSDSLGIFTFPYLPAGEYSLVAYDDLNRNREPDFTEPQDSAAISLAVGDTVVVTDIVLLAPDTTAAVVQEGMVLDSTTVRIIFDDYLDPEDPLTEVQARLVQEDETVPEVVEIVHAHAWEPPPAALEPEPEPDPDAPSDAPPGDPQDPDVDDVPPLDVDPLDPDPPDPGAPDPGAPDPGAPEGPPLPDRELILILSAPLIPDVTYGVEVEGVMNINGVPGGGGSIEIERVLPPDPEPDPDADPADDPDATDEPDDPGDVGDPDATDEPESPGEPAALFDALPLAERIGLTLMSPQR